MSSSQIVLPKSLSHSSIVDSAARRVFYFFGGVSALPGVLVVRFEALVEAFSQEAQRLVINNVKTPLHCWSLPQAHVFYNVATHGTRYNVDQSGCQK